MSLMLIHEFPELFNNAFCHAVLLLFGLITCICPVSLWETVGHLMKMLSVIRATFVKGWGLRQLFSQQGNKQEVINLRQVQIFSQMIKHLIKKISGKCFDGIKLFSSRFHFKFVFVYLCLHRFLLLLQAVISTSAAHQKCWLSYSKGKSILTCSLAFPCETKGSSLLWQAPAPSTPKHPPT